MTSPIHVFEDLDHAIDCDEERVCTEDNAPDAQVVYHLCAQGPSPWGSWSCRTCGYYWDGEST